MSCPYKYTAGLLKVLEVVRDCNDLDVEGNTHSLVPHQSDVSVPDQGLSSQGYQTPTSERKNDRCSNIAQNSAEMDNKLNPDIVVPESPRSTNPKFPHYTTPTTSTTLNLSLKSFKSNDSVLESQNKTFGSEVASTSAFTTTDKIQHSSVLTNESSILNKNTSSASVNAEYSEKYPNIIVGTLSTNLNSSNPSVSDPNHENHEIPVRKLVEDFKSLNFRLRDSGPSRSQLDGRKRKNEEKKNSVVPHQARAITKRGSGSFENLPKSDPTIQFPFPSNPAYDPFLPLAFQKPCSLKQTKFYEGILEPSTYGTKKPDPQYPLTRSSALHPFVAPHAIIPLQGYNNAACGPNIHTAAQLSQLYSFESGNFNKLYHEAQRCLHRSSTSNPSRLRFVASEEPRYPFTRRGIPEAVRYTMPKTSESCFLGARNFNPTYHRTKHPRGGSYEVQRCRHQGTDTAGFKIAENQLNALSIPSRSYASVATSIIDINWAPSIRGKIIETGRLMLKPSFIPSLSKEMFEKICREGIICEDNGCYYMVFKVNNPSTHGREYHVRYVTSQNLDGTYNFNPDDNGRPTAGVKWLMPSSTHVIMKWLMSLPRPEDMDKIR
ncbi:hypothetical protein TNCT_224071 [Trichonephila clavata]|uniref:Uncharacterized protein n=1 Tax=Trichonephila clavata TaxID=2740835 RepID=A0A8X6LD12_TRICU|nr:hypothetical protein TNCT_224071 [Trichonephila clavata]